MKNVEFTSQSNAEELHKELTAAGFAVIGVSTDNTGATPRTIVHLEDNEDKDPTRVVNTHTYTAPVETKPISEAKLIEKLIANNIISSRADLE